MSDLQAHSRRWCLDLGCPAALLAAGASVDLLVRSGVGRYLEFQAVEALCVAGDAAPAAAAPGAPAVPGHSDAPPTLGLWNVPCSKRDIFASKALTMMEKNRLMKVRSFPSTG